MLHICGGKEKVEWCRAWDFSECLSVARKDPGSEGRVASLNQQQRPT